MSQPTHHKSSDIASSQALSKCSQHTTQLISCWEYVCAFPTQHGYWGDWKVYWVICKGVLSPVKITNLDLETIRSCFMVVEVEHPTNHVFGMVQLWCHSVLWSRPTSMYIYVSMDTNMDACMSRFSGRDQGSHDGFLCQRCSMFGCIIVNWTHTVLHLSHNTQLSVNTIIYERFRLPNELSIVHWNLLFSGLAGLQIDDWKYSAQSVTNITEILMKCHLRPNIFDAYLIIRLVPENSCLVYIHASNKQLWQIEISTCGYIPFRRQHINSSSPMSV